MGNQRILFIVLGIVVVGVVGFTLVSGSSTPQESAKEEVGEQKSTSDVQGIQEVDEPENDLSKRYLGYSEENLALATKDGGRAVIFFHAGWCATCKAAEADFKANFDKVPSDVTILKTDFDTSTELKKKYGVTMQDNFVQVDGTGAGITQWTSGGEGIKALLANIK